MKYNWETFPKWHDSDTETMKDILAWVVRHKRELREFGPYTSKQKVIVFNGEIYVNRKEILGK